MVPDQSRSDTKLAISNRSTWLVWLLFAHRSKVNSASVIQILSRESWVRLQESAEIDDLIDNVTWVAATHHALAIAVLGLDQIIDCFFVVGYASALAVLQKDPFKLVFGGIGDIDLIGDPSQKGLVHQISWIEVGREHYQLLEGDFELFACVKG